MTFVATVAENLHAGAHSLDRVSDSPRLDAEILLGKILGLSRSGLIAHGHDAVTNACETAYADLIDQRRNGAPVAYLTGSREFWSLPFTVTRDVLVPRPETEVLVECALTLIASDRPCTVLDLGTGSGAIALAIASERPAARVTGVDVSGAALAVAAHNARYLRLNNVEWRMGSWFDAVKSERFETIVANPPYIAASDPALAALAAEPAIALSPGPSGLEALAAIAAEAASHLSAEGWLIMEHGSDQAAAVEQIFELNGFHRIKMLLDFSGKPRVTRGTVHSHQ